MRNTEKLICDELVSIRKLLELQTRFFAYTAPGFGNRDWLQNELAMANAEIAKNDN